MPGGNDIIYKVAPNNRELAQKYTDRPIDQINDNRVATSGYKSFLSGIRNQKLIFCIIDGAEEVNYAKVGNTIFNNTNYTKLIPDHFSGNISSNLYLREDTISGKLWSYDSTTNKEWLSVDMSMKIGDTLLINPIRYSNYYDTIAIVDSLFFDTNGLKHLVFNLSCFNFALSPVYNKLEFIESVGSNFGLGYQTIHPFINLYQEILLCAFSNGRKIYSHPSQSGDLCTLIIDNLADFDKSAIIIYPNPCSLGIYISCSAENKSKKVIVIKDITGKLIYKEEFNSSKQNIFISTANFLPGIYVIEVQQNNSITNNMKVIVTK